MNYHLVQIVSRYLFVGGSVVKCWNLKGDLLQEIKTDQGDNEMTGVLCFRALFNLFLYGLLCCSSITRWQTTGERRMDVKYSRSLPDFPQNDLALRFLFS